MSTKPIFKTFASLLITLLIAPSALLSFPQQVEAIPVVETGGNLATNIITTVQSILDVVQNTISAVAEVATEIAVYADYVNTYVLQPLAFIMSGNLLKSLTAGVISFVVGKTNGTGAPQFVRNVQGTMQSVGDKSALAFFAQFNSNSNSPFASSIRSSLATNYMQNTSLAGFWGANQNTLYKSSPNPNAFLSGRWSQGGVAAWFSLTTQSQNNPYLFYQASQAQLSNLVANATAARLSQLNWGQGFGSWCGNSDSATERENTAATGYATCVADCNEREGGASCVDACAALYNSAGGAFGGQSGVNPGEPCTNKDGTPGTVQTPGSTIKATLDKVLGSQQDKLVQIGQISTQMGSIMSSIGSVMQTVDFASQILGGSGGGLFTVGGGGSSGSNSRLAQFAPFQSSASIGSTNYLGASSTSVYEGASAIGASGSDKSGLIDRYELAWNSIKDSADAALASVTDLKNFCTNATVGRDNCSGSFIDSANSQAATAQVAIDTEIMPIFSKVAETIPIISEARAMVEKIQEELNSAGDGTTANNYTSNVQTLRSMAPTASDVANAEQNARSYGIGGMNADGTYNNTLFVPAGQSIIDQMTTIAANAQVLKSVCIPSPSQCLDRNSD